MALGGYSEASTGTEGSLAWHSAAMVSGTRLAADAWLAVAIKAGRSSDAVEMSSHIRDHWGDQAELRPSSGRDLGGDQAKISSDSPSRRAPTSFAR